MFLNPLKITATLINISLITFATIFTSKISAQSLVNFSYEGNMPISTLNFLIQGGVHNYDVDYYQLEYKTVDLNGDSVIASGLVAVPISTCDSFASALLLHGTVFGRDEAPSMGGLEQFVGFSLASAGTIAMMPDYMGLGLSTEHPEYLVKDLQVTNTSDFLAVARPFLIDELNIHLTGEGFVMGGSQGGYNVLAIQDAYDHQLLPNWFEPNLFIALSAPTSLSKFMVAPVMQNTPYPFMPAILNAVESYQYYYGDIYTQPSDVYLPGFDTIIPVSFNGDVNFDDLPIFPLTSDSIFTASFLQSFRNDSGTFSLPLWQHLLYNDVDNYYPNQTLELNFCLTDQIVDPENSLEAYSKMSTNSTMVSAKDLGFFDHQTCNLEGAKDFIANHINDYLCFSVPGNVSNISKAELSLYPNPAVNSIRVNSDQQVHWINIYNASGQLVKTTTNSSTSVAELPNGNYIVVAKLANTIMSNTLIKK